MSNAIKSVSYTPKPIDRRCRFWCKVIEPGMPLPAPADVQGANDLPGPYLRTGDEIELFEGDWVLEGEEVSHTEARGWVYNLVRAELTADGGVHVEWHGRYKDRAVKAWLREQGDKEDLRGSGDVAAMVRYLRAVRAGYGAPVDAPTEPTPEPEPANVPAAPEEQSNAFENADD